MFDPSARLYMRFRGKTTGPFTLAQVEQMRQLGRVTAFHEVSTDGVNWILAGDAGLVASPGMGQNAAPMPLPMPLAAGSPPWYHLDAAGARQGPIPREQMVDMVAAGKFAGSSEVWCEGFADWVPLQQTELAGFLPRKQATVAKGTTQLLVSPTTAPTPTGGNGIVVAGYLFCVGSSFPCPALGIPALICAILNLSRRRVSHGLAQLFLSIVLQCVGWFLWYLAFQQINKE